MVVTAGERTATGLTDKARLFSTLPVPTPAKYGVRSRTPQRTQGLWVEARAAAHLNTLLVALEKVSARVPGAVPLEELLGKPTIKTLIILALHVGAPLPDAVHGGGGGGAL